MKILYIVSRPLEINTSASIRNRATIEGLIQLGHQVDLITSHPDKNHSNFDDSIKIEGLKTTYLQLAGVQRLANIGRKYKFLKLLKSIAYKYMNEINIYDNLKGIVNHVDKIKIYEKDYDLIISSSDPKSSHLFVMKMFENKMFNNIPWIQIWGDPFFTDITRSNKNRILDNKIRREEDKLLKYPQKVIYVSNFTLIQQQNLYPHYSKKMFYIPIPYIKEEIYPEVNLTKNSLTFLYCGDYLSNVRNIKPLYKAISKSNHKLIICGHSDLKLDGTERIKVYPRVSYEKMKEFELECDVLVHLSNLSGTQIPGKIYQYSGTNKPILFILDGEYKDIFNTFSKYNRFVFSNNCANHIQEKINTIEKECHKLLLRPIDIFSKENIANKIISI